MPAVEWWLLLLVVPVMVFSGWVHGALGLGFPMIATPLIAIFIDVKIAILLTLMPTATVNVASILSATNLNAAISKHQPLVWGSLAGAVIGSFLLSRTETEPYRLVLAGLILLFLVTSYFNLKLKLTPGIGVMLVFGFLAGISAGTTNVMVAILIIYFLSANIERAEMVPAMNMCFLVGKLSQIAVFLATGMISVIWLVYTIPLAIVSYLALKAGQKHGAEIDVERYKKYLQIVLLVLAGVLLAQFFYF